MTFNPEEPEEPRYPIGNGEKDPDAEYDKWREKKADEAASPSAPATPQTYGKPYSHPMDDSFECQDSPPATPQLPPPEEQ